MWNPKSVATTSEMRPFLSANTTTSNEGGSSPRPKVPKSPLWLDSGPWECSAASFSKRAGLALSCCRISLARGSSSTRICEIETVAGRSNRSSVSLEVSFHFGVAHLQAVEELGLD